MREDHGGSLLTGTSSGEKLINQFDFYSAFTSGEEFRIVAEGQVLGSLPIERPLHLRAADYLRRTPLESSGISMHAAKSYYL